MPILALALSEINPPTPRAKRFIQPKIEAMAAADSVVSSNLKQCEIDRVELKKSGQANVGPRQSLTPP